MHIQSHYVINEQTSALLPVKHYDYQTLVIENQKQIYVKQTPIEIIQYSCLSRFTLYEGIKKAVIKKTGFKRKTPIPISPHQNIYFFPTHATDNFNCCWISFYHVNKIVNPQNHQLNKYSSIILLKNGQNLKLDISCYILNRQMKRTLECVNSYLKSQISSASMYDIV